jgi:hypothetical protein
MDVSRSNDNAAFRVGGLTVLRRYFRERRSRRAGGDARSHTIPWSSLLALQHGLGGLHDGGRGEAVLLHQLVRKAGFGVSVVDADGLHRYRLVMCQHIRDARSESAVEQVLLGGDDGAALAGRSVDRVFVDRFQREHVDHARVDAVVFELRLRYK